MIKKFENFDFKEEDFVWEEEQEKELKEIQKIDKIRLKRNSAEDEGLYDDMTDLLTMAERIFRLYSGEDYSFDPYDAMESMLEIPDGHQLYNRAQYIHGEIDGIQEQIDNLDSEDDYYENEDE